MDRIKLQCNLSGKETEVQLDKKMMPGETGPCFMLTVNGYFRGYISMQKGGTYQSLGPQHYPDEDIRLIGSMLHQGNFN